MDNWNPQEISNSFLADGFCLLAQEIYLPELLADHIAELTDLTIILPQFLPSSFNVKEKA